MSKDRLTRMIEAQQEAERQRGSLRPLKEITIYLSCGCDSIVMSDKNIAPAIGTELFCFSHMCNVRVRAVEVL